MYTPFSSLNFDKRFISVIGSGGKTTFLRYLSSRLRGTVILTTSTHFYPPTEDCLITSGLDDSYLPAEQVQHDIRSALMHHRVIILGQKVKSGKLGDPSGAVSFEALKHEADHIIVEADGSHHLPLKAHRSFEPVIPPCSDLTVCLIGASGIGQTAKSVCHCSELFCELAGISENQMVTEQDIATVINRENLADIYLVNQFDVLSDPMAAIRLCQLIEKPASICQLDPVFSGFSPSGVPQL